MKNKQLTTAIIGLLGLVFALAAWLGGLRESYLVASLIFGGGLFLWAVFSLLGGRLPGGGASNYLLPGRSQGITRVELLNEDDGVTTTWELYDKVSAVIGKDVRENQVDIDLAASEYASLVDVEHAVLNYAEGNWYVEDLASHNGVAVQKKADGRKYRLSPDQPCKLAPGDIVIIGLSRLRFV
ncbi:MAG: FHA domain-containing protein [Selenomonadaceae bacterium]|nr:FHA domain-containing protein [Selenomonadaceae bacterium]